MATQCDNIEVGRGCTTDIARILAGSALFPQKKLTTFFSRHSQKTA